MAHKTDLFCRHGHDTSLVGRDKLGRCRECTREGCKRWHDNHLEQAKESCRKWNHNHKSRAREHSWKHSKIINLNGSYFTVVDFDRLYQIQQGKCAICLVHSTEFKRTLAVDHNHKTGIVRGLLCDGCNAAVGFFEKRKSEMESYLAKHKPSIAK